MRVVAGTAGGRRLVAPKGRAIRPTSDRVREALFSSLGASEAIEGRAVLDLFCGSGALGVEALSRGAARVTFVDDDRDAIAATRANLNSTGLEPRAEVDLGCIARLLLDDFDAGEPFAQEADSPIHLGELLLAVDIFRVLGAVALCGGLGHGLGNRGALHAP